MSTGWIRGRFVGTYAGELAGVRGDGARRYSLELQSGTVHDAQWVAAPADADCGGDGDGDGDGASDRDGAAAGQHRRQRLSHVRFAPPGEPERVGTLYDLRVEVTQLRRAHELGTRSFGRLEGTIVARTSPPQAPAAAEETKAAEPLALPPAQIADSSTTSAAQPAAASAAIAPEPAGPVLATAPRVEPLRPFVQPIRRASATPLEPVPHGFHPAWLLVALVMAWLGLSAWLLCGPVAATTWAAPLVVGALLRRSTLRLRLRSSEALGWASVALLFAQLALLVGPAEHAWRADCLPPLGLKLPLQAGLVVLTVLLSRLGPIAIATLCWTLLTFGWCDHVDGTCGERAALARAERRWPKDPERVAAVVAAEAPHEPTAPAAPSAAPSAPPPDPEPAMPAPSATPLPSAGAAAAAEPAAAAPAREPPHPAAPISMEQANRNPRSFLGSKGKRSVVLPTQPIFGEQGAEISAEGTVELSRLAALLKLQGKRRVRVELHTEPRGDAAREQELTDLQAHAVRTWLERTGGIDTARLDVLGLGSRRPLATLPVTSDLPDTDRRLELHVLEASGR